MNNYFSSKHLNILMSVAWLSLVGAGIWKMSSYSLTVGAVAVAPHILPDQLQSLVKPNLPSLFMALHSRCRCSRASLHELQRLVTRLKRPASIVVLIQDPSDDLGAGLEILDNFPGVVYLFDRGGAFAALLGARTSGATSLYDSSGRLVFSGGITPSRGHQGNNVGEEFVVSWLNGEGDPPPKGALVISASAVSKSPVFGCRLVEHSQVGAGEHG